MRRPVWIFCLAATASLIAGAASAVGPVRDGIVVQLDQSRRVVLPGIAANVVVANPTVADVAMVDTHSVVLMGRGYGVTEILVTDHQGRTLMDSRVAVVGSDEGHVTVTQGGKTAEYACSTRCAVLPATAGDAAEVQASASGAQATSGSAPTPAPPPRM